MSGFDDLRKHHAENVMLSTERFAESVEIAPPGGAMRTIIASCRRTTIAEVNPETGEAKDVDTLIVSVMRDREKGIYDPVPGYTLRRAATKDFDRRLYQYDGVIEEASDYTWQLVFTRPTRRREVGR
jgi:hypothetical protein